MQLNIILAVLAAILAVPCWYVIQDERVEDFVDEDQIPVLFPGFSGDLVSVIRIRRRLSEELIQAQKLEGEAQFEQLWFQREGEGWKLVNHRDHTGLALDPAAIDRDILEHVEALRVESDTLVPEDMIDDAFRKEKQLTLETGVEISLLRGPQGPELAKLHMGASTKGGAEAGGKEIEGYYVCRPDRPRQVIIYEPKDRDWRMSLRSSDWALKQIHEFLLSEVEAFYFSNDLGSAGFKRKKGAANQWVAVPEQCKQGTVKMDLTKMGDVIHDNVMEMVSKYATKITAEDFDRAKVTTDEIGNEVEVRATMKDGTEFVLRVGKERDGINVSEAVASNHPFKFLIANFNVEAFRRQDPKDLFHPK